jgi:ADP-ribose pyrophosphatase YjhB (NUDIX family)
MDPTWLDWARALQIIAQNGLAYSKDPFDVERFESVRQIAAQMVAAQTETSAGDLLDLFSGEKGYATPKIDVRGAAFQDGKVLLVRELLDQGRWTLPGGWADPGDSPSEAVLREMREESGFEARVVKLAAVFDRDRRGHPYYYFSVYKLFFLCEITGGAPAESIETGGVGFFGEHDLPELSLGRVTGDEIRMLFEHYRRPEIPTQFD